MPWAAASAAGSRHSRTGARRPGQSRARDADKAAFTSSSRPAMASMSCGREVGERWRPANSRACNAFSVAGTSCATASMAGSFPASAIQSFNTVASRGALPRIMSAAFSAIISTEALRLADGMVGMTEASTTRRPSSPRTRS